MANRASTEIDGADETTQANNALNDKYVLSTIDPRSSTHPSWVELLRIVVKLIFLPLILTENENNIGGLTLI